MTIGKQNSGYEESRRCCSFWKKLWRFLTGEASTEKMVRKFIEVFPDRCMICSYHGFGLREGFLKNGTPVEPHDCIEKGSHKVASKT